MVLSTVPAFRFGYNTGDEVLDRRIMLNSVQSKTHVCKTEFHKSWMP